MPTHITVTLQDRALRGLLSRLALQHTHRDVVFDAMGAALVSSTQQRFMDQRGPDGTPWEPLQPETIARRARGQLPKLRGQHRLQRKDGELRKGAPSALANVPILRDRGDLFGSLTFVADNDGFTVGSNKVQAAIQQLGGTDDMPRGAAAVPARPFLGVSGDDERTMGELLVAHYEQAAA